MLFLVLTFTSNVGLIRQQTFSEPHSWSSSVLMKPSGHESPFRQLAQSVSAITFEQEPDT